MVHILILTQAFALKLVISSHFKTANFLNYMNSDMQEGDMSAFSYFAEERKKNSFHA